MDTTQPVVFRNATVVDAEGGRPGMRVACRGGRIESLARDDGAPLAPGEVDAAGRFLCPGFIDLHMHGAMGYRSDKSSEELEALSLALPRFGVTGFLPAVTPIQDAPAHLAALAAAGFAGARALGFFLEGDFLSLTGGLRRVPGGQTPEGVRRLKAAAAPYPLIFAISPELPGIEDLLPAMTEGGLPAFITHTAADVRQTQRAIALGARHATHFYNVFPYPGDKELGVRGCGATEAVLADKSVSLDIILDGEHIDPIVGRVALVCKDADQVCLITDANSCAGLPPGVYTGLDEQEVILPANGGPARVRQEDGSPGYLVGSGLTMDIAVRNAMDLLGLPLHRAIAMATLNPATVLGLQGSKGRVAPGYDADLVLLDDAIRVAACYAGGQQVYGAEA